MAPKSVEECENRLRKLNDEFEEFAYIVSHDLKAPVRAVNNLATWLEEDLEGNLPGDSAQNFNMLKNRLSRLDAMIQALLDFSRVSRFELEIYPVQIAELINHQAEKLRSEYNFKLSLNGSVSGFNTFGGKLTTVLQQILTNAVRFNDNAGKEITVNLSQNEDYALIAIADNGPGIPAASLPKIFTMFYTVHAKDSRESTGAGLAIVNKIINFVNGRIQVANKPEGGAEFTIWWPKTIQTQ